MSRLDILSNPQFKARSMKAVEVGQDALGFILLDAEGHPVGDYYPSKRVALKALRGEPVRRASKRQVGQLEKIIGRLESLQHGFPSCRAAGHMAEAKSLLIKALSEVED